MISRGRGYINGIGATHSHSTLFIHAACLSTRLSAFSDRGMLCCAVPPLPRTVRPVPCVPVAHPCFALSVACRVCVGSAASLSAVHRRPLRRGSDEEISISISISLDDLRRGSDEEISISISLDDLRRGSDEEKREDLI